MVLSKPEYMLTHGPDRSHDSLETVRFNQLHDATDAALDLPSDRCWRILRISGGKGYAPQEVKCVSRGGPDDVEMRKRAEFRAQYRTAKG